MQCGRMRRMMDGTMSGGEEREEKEGRCQRRKPVCRPVTTTICHQTTCHTRREPSPRYTTSSTRPASTPSPTRKSEVANHEVVRLNVKSGGLVQVLIPAAVGSSHNMLFGAELPFEFELKVIFHVLHAAEVIRRIMDMNLDIEGKRVTFINKCQSGQSRTKQKILRYNSGLLFLQASAYAAVQRMWRSSTLCSKAASAPSVR